MPLCDACRSELPDIHARTVMKQNQSTILNVLLKSVLNVIKCGTTLGNRLMQINGVPVANTTHTKKKIFKEKCNSACGRG